VGQFRRDMVSKCRRGVVNPFIIYRFSPFFSLAKVISTVFSLWYRDNCCEVFSPVFLRGVFFLTLLIPQVGMAINVFFRLHVVLPPSICVLPPSPYSFFSRWDVAGTSSPSNREFSLSVCLGRSRRPDIRKCFPPSPVFSSSWYHAHFGRLFHAPGLPVRSEWPLLVTLSRVFRSDKIPCCFLPCDANRFFGVSRCSLPVPTLSCLSFRWTPKLPRL